MKNPVFIITIVTTLLYISYVILAISLYYINYGVIDNFFIDTFISTPLYLILPCVVLINIAWVISLIYYRLNPNCFVNVIKNKKLAYNCWYEYFAILEDLSFIYYELQSQYRVTVIPSNNLLGYEIVPDLETKNGPPIARVKQYVILQLTDGSEVRIPIPTDYMAGQVKCHDAGVLMAVLDKIIKNNQAGVI